MLDVFLLPLIGVNVLRKVIGDIIRCVIVDWLLFVCSSKDWFLCAVSFFVPEMKED
jgi:hypothetical protein